MDNSPTVRSALVYPHKSLVTGALVPALHRPAGTLAAAATKPAVGRVRHPADPYAQDLSVHWYGDLVLYASWLKKKEEKALASSSHGFSSLAPRSPAVAAATGASALPSLGTRWQCEASNIAGKHESVVAHVLELFAVALAAESVAASSAFLCARILKVCSPGSEEAWPGPSSTLLHPWPPAVEHEPRCHVLLTDAPHFVQRLARTCPRTHSAPFNLLFGTRSQPPNSQLWQQLRRHWEKGGLPASGWLSCPQNRSPLVHLSRPFL